MLPTVDGSSFFINNTFLFLVVVSWPKWLMDLGMAYGVSCTTHCYILVYSRGSYCCSAYGWSTTGVPVYRISVYFKNIDKPLFFRLVFPVWRVPWWVLILFLKYLMAIWLNPMLPSSPYPGRDHFIKGFAIVERTHRSQKGRIAGLDWWIYGCRGRRRMHPSWRPTLSGEKS